MLGNKVLNKSLTILTHPLSVSAITIYALNTFFLRYYWPSWWTGKLGDFAWFFFFPYIFTGLFALFLHPKLRDYSFPFALTSVATVFVLIKTTSLNGFAVHFLNSIFHLSFSITKDPSDLIALTALFGTVLFWKKYQSSTITYRKAGIFIVALGMLLTLADSAMPDSGLNYLNISNNVITTCSNYSTYQSHDGGITWEELPNVSSMDCPNQPQGNIIVFDPQDSAIQYRYQPGVIERSADGGKNWTTDYSWRPLSEAQEVYFETLTQSIPLYSAPPVNALADPTTGNIIFAMGQEGILVRHSKGNSLYSWIPIGHYQKIQFSSGEAMLSLLWGEGILSLLAGGLGISLSLNQQLKKNKWNWFFTIIIVLLWFAVAFVLPPAFAFQSSYSGIFSLAGMFIVGVMTLPIVAFSLFHVATTSRALLARFLILSLVIPVLYMIPFVLWVFNIIPHYYFALPMAICLVIILLVKQRSTVIKTANTDQAEIHRH